MKVLLHSGPWDQPGQTLPFLLFFVLRLLYAVSLCFLVYTYGRE